ncbi:hypothetical protein YC2023_065986 [Brassica napus]
MLVLGVSTLSLPVDCSGDFGPRGLFVQYTQDVRGCPPAHTGRPWVSASTHRTSICESPSAHTGRLWLSISTHISTLVLGLSTLTLPVDCLGDFGPRGLSVQYRQDVCGCPPANTGRPLVSVCVRQQTHRTSVAVHQYTYQHVGPWTQHADPSRGLFGTLVLGLSTLALPVDCSGDFGPCGLSLQYRQDVRGCPPANTGRPLLSVCVRQQTHRTFVAVHQYTYQHVVHTGRLWVSTSTHMTSVAVRVCRTLALPVDCSGDFGPCGLSLQYTQDIGGCPSAHTEVRGCPPSHTGRLLLSVCVRVCPSAHTGRLWLSISTHISMLVLGFSTLTLPVDCSSDFGPRGLSVQYTQDVCGYPPAHTGRPWLSVCARVCLCVSVSTHRTSVAVHQYTYHHAVHTGRPWVSVSTHRTSVAVRVCPSAHTGRPWLSIITHISTLVLGLSTPTLPVDCLGDFGPRGLSVQYTQDFRGTHISTLVLGFSTLTLPVDCSSDFGPRGQSVQYTQDVCGYPPAHTGRLWVSPAHTGRPWLSVCVRVCLCVSVSTHRTSVAVYQYTYHHAVHTGRPLVSVSTHRTFVAVRVCPSAHTGRPWLSISTHISTLVLGLSTLTLPGDWSGDFGPRGLSVQYTQEVRGCPTAHTGRLWLSVCVRVCPSAHTERPWLSISTHISTLVLGFSTLTLPVDCSSDFGPRGLSVQYKQDVCGCPPAHTGRLWVSASTHRTSVAVRVCPCVSVCVLHTGHPWVSASTHRTSVCVSPSAHTGRLWLSISTHISMLVLGLSTLTLPVDCLGDFGPRGLSVQYRQDVRGCPPENTGRPWLSVCVRQQTHRTSVAVHQYTYQHIGPWTQHADPSRGLFGTLVLGLSTLALPVDCSGDFVPRGLSLQYTQDIGGCPSAHTGRPWVSAITHRTSVAVRVCPSAHTGRLWLSISTHISMLVLGFSTLTLPVDCSSDFGPRGLSVQYTQDVCGCPPPHTGRPWLSVCVRVCLCVSVSTHRTSVAVHHTHRTSVGVRQHTQDVRGCPCLSISTHRTSVAVHQYTYQHVSPWTQHADPSRGLFGMSVAVRVCPCVSVSTHRRPWLSISTHISTLVLGFSTLTHPVDCSSDFGPRGLSVQYTQDVCGCPPAHTGLLWDVRSCPSVHISPRWSLESARWPFPWTVRVILAHEDCLFSTHRTSVGVRQNTQDVRLCESVSTHRTSVAVHHTDRTSVGVRQQTQDVRGCPCVSVSKHIGRPWLSISTHISTLVLGLSTPTLPVDCLGDFGPRGLSVQYTQDFRGCPPSHTGRPLLSVCVRQHTQDVCGCPSVHISARCTHRTSVGVRQHTQEVCGCPPAHTGRLWLSVCVRVCLCVSVSTHRTSVAVHHTHRTSVGVRQHTQDVCGCPCVSISTHRTSVAVHQYTYQHVVHTGGPWVSDSTHMTSVAVRVCPSAHTGRPWLSISTHISMLVLGLRTLVLGLSTLALPVDCSGDFGPRGLSVQYTQDVSGCPSAHTGRPCVSVSTHRISVVVHQYTYQHVGPWTQPADPSRGLFG